MASRGFTALSILTVSTTLLGCASTQPKVAGDPLQSMNRSIYAFNGKVDTYVARPVAKGYENVTPRPVQTAVRNFFSNLGDIGNFANDTLQLKPTAATEDLMRFAFNSTFGIAGLIDWATPAGIPKHHQDFGLTLARYGVQIGPYLVLPLLGPSSIRDVSNVAFNALTNPFQGAPFAVTASMTGVHVVSGRADMLGTTDLLEAASLDQYAFVRNFYLNRRRMLAAKPGAPTEVPQYSDNTTLTPGTP